MAYKISGNIIIDNNGDIRNVGVATIGLIDGKVSEKAITEQTAGTEGDVTGADEILLYDSATNGLLRVTVDEFIGGSGIGTIVTEFEQLTVTGITTVGFLTATDVWVGGATTITGDLTVNGTITGDGSGLTGIANSLGALTDTNIPAPTDGQALVYDSTGKEWVAGLAPAFEVDAANNVYVPDLTGTPPFTTGSDNTLIGLDAGTNITSASNNVFFGPNSGKSFSSGDNNVAIGNSAIPNLDDSIANVVIGVRAGRDITQGSSNTIIGNNAAAETVGSLRNVFVGTLAGGGFGGGPDNLTDNVAIGQQAAAGIRTDTSDTIYIGALSGCQPVGVSTASVYLGIAAGADHDVGSCVVAVGPFAGRASCGNNNIFLGRSAGSDLIGIDNLYAGVLAGFGTDKVLSTGNAIQNIGLGVLVHRYVDSGTRNVAIGYAGQYRLTTASNNNSIGAFALCKLTTGGDNTAVGNNALCDLTTGIGNVGLGFNALRGLLNGQRNVAVGDGAGFNLLGSAQENTIIGPLNYVFNGGTQGSRNVILGSRIDAPANNADDILIIGNNTNRWITGDSNYDVTIPNDLTVVGTVTATSFDGDGSALSGVTTALGNLSDVNLTGLKDGEVIKYDEANEEWVPGVGPAFNVDANDNVYAEQLIGTASFTTGRDNTVIGKDSGISISTGDNNVILGKEAGQCLTSGFNNVLFGTRAGRDIGALGTFNSECNVAIGADAMVRAEDSIGNVAIGVSAMSVGNEFTTNIAIGAFSLKAINQASIAVEDNVVIGFAAGAYIDSSESNPVRGNLIFGNQAGQRLDNAEFNVIIGNQSGQYISAGSEYNIIMGSRAGQGSGGFCNIYIGRAAGLQLSSTTFGAQNIGMGALALCELNGGACNIAIGAYSGSSLTTGELNTAVGSYSAFSLIAGNQNTYLGERSGNSHQAGDQNTFIGAEAGVAFLSGIQNTIVGAAAATGITVGSYNNIVGSRSATGLTNANDNNVMGMFSMTNVTTGTYNTVFGNYAGTFLAGASSRNVIIGSRSASTGSGGVSNDNVVIGYEVELPVGNTQLLIGNYANLWITGDSSFNVEIPNELTVSSTLNIGGDIDSVRNINATGITTVNSLIVNDSIDASIDALNDVDTTTTPPTDGQILEWNNANGEWAPADSTGIEVDANNNVYQSELIGTPSFTIANNNTLFGTDSGTNITSGNQNTAFGYLAGSSVTLADANAFFGDQAGRRLIDGRQNTFIGGGAGVNLQFGSYNNLVGNLAGGGLTNANDNNVMGAFAMNNVTTGTYNTIFGNYGANRLTSSSSRNLIMGSLTLNSGTGGIYNDNVLIGFGMEIDPTSNQLHIGNTTNRWITGDSSYNVNIPNDLAVGGSLTAPGLPTRESGSTANDQVIKTINMSTENVHKVEFVLRQTSSAGTIIDSSAFYYDGSSIIAAPPYATKQLNTQITGDVNTTGSGFRIQYGASGSVLTVSILDTQGGGNNPGYQYVLTTTVYGN